MDTTIKSTLCILLAVFCLLLAACAPAATPTPTRWVATPRPVTTPQVVVRADAPATPMPRPSQVEGALSTPEDTPTATATSAATPTAAPTPAPTPIPTPSFLQQKLTHLFDLATLPVLENTVTTQFTSRNWVSLEYYFDYFVDDGNFIGPHYGYISEDGARLPYRIVTGYDGTPEYEIVPRVQGPGALVRIWFTYQQHQSVNNPKDMSKDEEWANWGNLGAMGNIRFYFDDEPTPRIDFGIKELFVGKPPFPAPLAAFYATANGGNINYVPLPFQRALRVTTTGRPRMMQLQVKRWVAPHDAQAVQSFRLNLSSSEQATLARAAQAWQTCTPAERGERQTFTLAIPSNTSAAVDFGQPATITALRVRVPRGMDDSVWMQVFWDGALEPSLNGTLRGMFGTAERLLPYRALPLGIITDETETLFYNNFPMPFQSARIVFLNYRAETLPLTLEVTTGVTLVGTENVRLHALYSTQRMLRREDKEDNYILLDVKGSGKYLGAIFSAWDLDRQALNGPLSPHWRFPYLESNLDVWIDGRLALPGTGIEDDFNAGYYYVFTGYPGYVSTYCLSGVTLLDYNALTEPSSQYRFYLNDAPEFRNHLRVKVQHGNKGNNLTITYSSTAFWYQQR